MNTNQTLPELMSSQERLDEVAAILALGFSRLRQETSALFRSRTVERNSLDFPPPESVHGVQPERGGTAWTLE